LSGAVRKMLPTTSARNGGLVLGIRRSSGRLLRNVCPYQARAPRFVNSKSLRPKDDGRAPICPFRRSRYAVDRNGQRNSRTAIAIDGLL
jgi:hypothetical protein